MSSKGLPPPTMASLDETASSSEDEDISFPSLPSLSPEASSESDVTSSAGFNIVGAKKLGSGSTRTWPSTDEVALLEAVAAHREQHGRLPSPGDLTAALGGRLQADAEQLVKRLHSLRVRYDGSDRRLSRGIVPVTDDDIKIYNLSKRIWAASRTGKTKPPRAPILHHERREFGELAGTYPFLTALVEKIEASKPYSLLGMLKRAFERIGDEKATELEAKAKKQRIAELKMSMRLSTMRRKVAETLLEMVD